MSQRLKYARTTLVTILQEKLAEREATREAERAAREEKNAATAGVIITAMAAHTQFVVVMASAIREKLGLDVTSEDFAKELAEHYDYESGAASLDPDASLKKLIRAYEQASDEEIEVSIGDDVYAYI